MPATFVVTRKTLFGLLAAGLLNATALSASLVMAPPRPVHAHAAIDPSLGFANLVERVLTENIIQPYGPQAGYQLPLGTPRPAPPPRGSGAVGLHWVAKLPDDKVWLPLGSIARTSHL
jgi:hypothetical protein